MSIVNRRITVIHLIGSLEIGGAEVMLSKLLSAADQRGFNLLVISLTGAGTGTLGEKLRERSVPVYCLNMRKYSPLKALLLYIKLVKQVKPDIVQAWMYHANVLAMAMRPFLPRHSVYFNIRHNLSDTKHEKVLTRFMIKLNAWLSSFAEGVINNSLDSQLQHERIGFCKKNKIHIANGFDSSIFKPNKALYDQFRIDYRLPVNAKIVGMIARFHSVKNHRGFLEAAKTILEEYQHEVFFLMGGRECDEHNALLKKWTEPLILKERVLLLGEVDSSKVMPVLDVYLSASLSEGFPNVIGEAMACGVPCVATDVGDTRHIVEGYGKIVQKQEIGQLAEGVISILNLSQPELNQLGRKCRQQIEEKYPIQKIVRQYEKIYLREE